MNPSVNNVINIDTPSPENVYSYLKRWEEEEKFAFPEKALSNLFVHTYPKNTVLDQILIKASALNNLYYTNIFNILAVAKHIHALDIDERLNSGDISLVMDLAAVNIDNTHRFFYSFATKYCSFHKPDIFPIYDFYVEKVLSHFGRRDKFFTFDSSDLRDYRTFIRVHVAFQKHYGLTEFSKRQLDHYLWLAGKDFWGK